MYDDSETALDSTAKLVKVMRTCLCAAYAAALAQLQRQQLAQLLHHVQVRGWQRLPQARTGLRAGVIAQHKCNGWQRILMEESEQHFALCEVASA